MNKKTKFVIIWSLFALGLFVSYAINTQSSAIDCDNVSSKITVSVSRNDSINYDDKVFLNDCEVGNK